MCIASTPPDIFERIAEEFCLYGANILLMERK
jgi:hypothetical protein